MMLQSISSQLDQLEKSIEARIPEKQIEWKKEQITLIDRCEERLMHLERKITALTKKAKETDKAKKALTVNNSFGQESYTF